VSSKNDSIEASVTGLSPKGQIAYAKTEQYGVVTFATQNSVWQGDTEPQTGEIVILSELRKFRKGWRAMKARRFILTDESKDSACAEKN